MKVDIFAKNSVLQFLILLKKFLADNLKDIAEKIQSKQIVK